MSVDTKPVHHDLESTYQHTSVYGLSVSQLGDTLPNGWGNITTDSLNLQPQAQPTSASGWNPLVVPNVIPSLNDLDFQRQQVVSLQDIESSDGSISSLQSPRDTNASFQKQNSVLSYDAQPLSPRSPIQPRTQPKRPTRGTTNPKHEPLSKEPSPSAEALAASDRSERARKAANRRHSRAKDAAPSSNGQRTKTDIDREKNRIAAAKCRNRKRAATDALDAKYRAATAANNRMTQEHRELRDQLACWRMLALQHVSGLHGCQCGAIHRYNIDQAMKAVGDIDAARRGSFSFSSVGQGLAPEGFAQAEAGRRRFSE